jgi:hypothetical protein
MTEAFHVLTTLVSVVAVIAFWAIVIFVIPAYIALAVASWIPQTGQWRKHWAELRRRKKK